MEIKNGSNGEYENATKQSLLNEYKYEKKDIYENLTTQKKIVSFLRIF